jgi:ketosteroid isomerase-like protein
MIAIFEKKVMKKILLILLVLLNHKLFSQSTSNPDLNRLLDRYVASIDAADSLMGSAFWSHSPDVSFIHPKGNEYGWEGVKNFYRMFSTNFSNRKLKYQNPRWVNYGETAWVEFNWVFDAVFKDGGQKMESKGRETQIWNKEKGEWKLVHVHYSGMPVTGKREGF